MRQFTCPKAVTHPSTNRARCRATVLIETNALLLRQTANSQMVVPCGMASHYSINTGIIKHGTWLQPGQNTLVQLLHRQQPEPQYQFINQSCPLDQARHTSVCTAYTGHVTMQSAFGKRLLRHKQRLHRWVEHKNWHLLNRKRLRQAHLFTLFLRISTPSNWESSDVALVRISEKVKQSDNFVYAITKYVTTTSTKFTNHYCHPNP